ncbi:MAG: helix-turn-helix domain-containing protein [Cyanobacteriota bacterium]
MRARFRRLWRRGGQVAAETPLQPPTDPLLAAGLRLRQAREQRQLSLRQLAMQTRISTAVLEALERGWRDRLPEPTYLRTMLPLIERHLELDAGSLDPVLPREQQRGQRAQQAGLLRRFTPGSIDVFTTWQGTVLYGVLILGLIYGLNLQQQRLARAGLLAVGPLPSPASEPASFSSQPASGTAMLLNTYPELQPLRLAEQGQGWRLWRRASSP